ncbi:MAG TPA: alpha/beta hydrolase [Desulfobulbus sp.]|nr:alpha/beta hydrolase [Desulfobulbus sp.]
MSATAIMDRPEILQVLFHPRTTARTPLPPESTDIDIATGDGVRIGCRLHGRNRQAPVILFFHGNGEVVADYDDVGPAYRQVGLNFLVTDYRGYGWSSGTPTSSTLLSDAHILYRELRQWLSDNGFRGDLFLMGRSLGSACAIELAATNDDEISGLIIESGFAETLPLARTLGIDLEALGVREEDTFNNVAKITRVTSPTFILHGQQDHLIPIWQAEKLMAASPARTKELQIIPGADHNSMMAVGGIHYFQAIRGFIDKVTGRSEDWRDRRRRMKEQQHKG